MMDSPPSPITPEWRKYCVSLSWVIVHSISCSYFWSVTPFTDSSWFWWTIRFQQEKPFPTSQVRFGYQQIWEAWTLPSFLLERCPNVALLYLIHCSIWTNCFDKWRAIGEETIVAFFCTAQPIVLSAVNWKNKVSVAWLSLVRSLSYCFRFLRSVVLLVPDCDSCELETTLHTQLPVNRPLHLSESYPVLLYLFDNVYETSGMDLEEVLKRRLRLHWALWTHSLSFTPSIIMKTR